MKTKKLSFKEISGVMSRSEMKKIMAGSGNATCCWHSADWMANGCGIDEDTAIARASQYAQQTGNHGYYCCQCQNH